MLKERYQNPTINDDLKLRLFTFNSHNPRSVVAVEKVEIYFSDEQEKSESNPQGWRLVETIDDSVVSVNDTGSYSINVSLEKDKYTIGNYKDVWTVKVDQDEDPVVIQQFFAIYPDLWYSTPMPIVYDFNFHFQPNKFRQGSIQYLIIEITPNVPRASDLLNYYENLAITANLKVFIAQRCGPCTPQEEDLKLIVEEESVEYREKRYGYYKFDTTDLECGIYDIWFKMEFGGNVYISDKMQFQIYS